MTITVKSKRGRLRPLLPLIAEWRDMGATWDEIRTELCETHAIEFSDWRAAREAVIAAQKWVKKRSAREVTDT